MGRRSRPGPVRAFLVGALVCAAAFPAAAEGRSLETGFADLAYRDPDPATRAFWFERTVEARAQIVRVTLDWSLVAPQPPANPADPADPAYDFTGIDGAVRDAAARGLRAMLTVVKAPAWAEGPGRPDEEEAPAGTWRPDPQAYGAFARAVAERYSGAFAPAPGEPPLPAVRDYQAWNEPNLWTWLTPQWDGGEEASAAHYRLLVNAFYEGVKAVDAQNSVISAGTAPYGTRVGEGLMRPLRFWRALLCLRGRVRLEPLPCPDPAHFDVAAHHPITGKPRRPADHPDDAAIPDLDRLRDVVRAAERARRALPAGRRPLWVTEIWWESNPPDPVLGIPLEKQARWIEEALYLVWREGVRVAILAQVGDQPTAGTPAANFQSGVYFADGAPKPALGAVRFPFVVDRIGRGRVLAWGRAPAGGRLALERSRGSGWRQIATLRVREGEVFRRVLALRGESRLRAAVAGEQSLPWSDEGGGR